MSDGKLTEWERRFRAAAAADGGVLLREHLRRLDLPDEPERLLEGTIRLVQMWAAYKDLDRHDFAPLLDMQTYDPCQAPNAHYAFTFDLHSAAYARVLVENEVSWVDLADLYGHPWRDYRVVGFRRLWISHLDWSRLTSDERQQLQDEVSGDLYFDYGEDEIDVWFDDELDDAYLLVTVQDVEMEG